MISYPALSDVGPLWPERYNAQALAEIRDDVGDYDWESLFQQAPVAKQGRVYSAFTRSTHVLPSSKIPTAFRRVIFGLDFGMAHPGVLIVLGETGTGDLYVIHEESHQRLLFSETDTTGKPGWLAIIAKLRDRWHPSIVSADPSEPGLIGALRQRLQGRPVVVGADNDISEGIRRVSVALAPLIRADGTRRPRLFVSDACPKLIAGFKAWSYVSTASGVSDTPSATGDDELDALRYAVIAL